MQLGIRLHDVNAALPEEEQTLEARARKAREEGFCCVHLALSKCIKGVTFDDAALTEGVAAHVRRVFQKEDLDVAVLGCYLNLAHPDPAKVAEYQSRYYGSLRVAALAGIGMVGTETGAPNAAYKLDENTHTREALRTFMWNLEPVLERAEKCGVMLAIEPVRNHIVYNADRALEVINAMESPNLRIIFDPVNLLASAELDQADAIFEEAMRRLGDRVRVLHMKDYRPAPENFRPDSIACGTGIMRYDALLSFAKRHDLPMTLEDTTPENAEAARKHLEAAAAAL